MTKKQLEAEVARLRHFERFAWEAQDIIEPMGRMDGNMTRLPIAVECLSGVLRGLRDELAVVAKAKAQRDLVVRRLHHILEVLDSLDEQLGQMGVSRVVRVRG